MPGLRDFTTEQLQTELERREMNIPETIRFTYYLHDNYEFGEFVEWFEDNCDFAFSDEIMRTAHNSFYEIALACDMDTRTGKVTILGIKE